MAGLPSTTISFDAEPPRLEVIVPAVEQRGGLPIETRLKDRSLRLCFVCRSEEEVEISMPPYGNVVIRVTDWSMKAGSLYQLVCETLIELGGKSTIEWRVPLQLPLTEASLRSEHRRVVVASLVVTILLAGTVAAILAGFGFVVWKVVTGS
ncbi:MAG: hypothetical protein LBP90_04415 [Burkholderiales bacterium]|jgi:nitrate reductase NapE component|nr:hypothetical protein [Burkholderiales bacterium]